MPNWLSNSEVVNLILIIIALISLAFQINSSEHSIRFAKRTVVALGRIITGTFGTLTGILVLLILQTIQDKTSMNWLEILNKFNVQSLLITIIAGSLVTFIASNAPSFQKSLVKSTIISIFLIYLADIVLQRHIQNIYIVIFTGIVTGAFMALLLHIFHLRNDNYITIIKNPFYD